MDANSIAMQRRDFAHARGCKICPTCDGLGSVHDDPEVRGSVTVCPTCDGYTWVDALGRPYDPDHPKNNS